MVLFLFSVILALVFLFAFSNGQINGGGLASAVIATRAMDPLPALFLVGTCEIVGLLIFGHAVSRTLARDLITFPVTLTNLQRLWIVATALMGASSWNILVGRMGLPSSSTHALVGGLAGSMLACLGPHSLDWTLFARIFFLLGVVPACGLFLSFFLTRFIYFFGGYITPAVGPWLAKLQIGAFAGAALGHGSNDGQKSVAMVALALPALGTTLPEHIPLWLLLGSGLSMALGTFVGSEATVQKVGQGFYRLQPVQGVCVEGATMLLIGLSSWAGYPMSTSHVVSSTVIGTGMATHPRSVRWMPVQEMVVAWLLTVPAAGFVAGLLMKMVVWFHVVS